VSNLTSRERSRKGRYSIAVVAACPFPANYGSAASIREMSDTLSDMGHNVHIVTYPFGQDDIRVRRAKVHRTGPFRSETNPKVGPSREKFSLDFQLLRLLFRVIHREKIDIIHAHNYEGALIGILAKWLTRRPLLYNAVNLLNDELAGYNFIRPAWLAHGIGHGLDWFTPIFPNHITAVSPELRDWFLKRGVPARKVDMIPAGIDPDLFDHPQPAKFREKYQLNGRPIVMYTGVLDAYQRIDYLLRAFAVALREKPDALLLVVNPLVSEACENEHKQLAAELGISNSIVWISPHPLHDLPSYLALADVCVVPRPECPGHPIKLLNYLLAGKPVVSFTGGAKGVRHMHDAFVVPNHDFEAMGRGIVTLLNDRALAEKLAANGNATVLAEFDWRQICRKIERVYDKLLVAPSEIPTRTQNQSAPFATRVR
jgi:glycosyltransferase involved in cell wall biosynthesis